MMISWRSHLIAFLLAGLFAQDCVSEEALPENAVPYGEDPAQRFELWVPEEATLQSRAPVLIYFPSSQLIFKEPHRFDPDPFLKSGIAVVVASYRKVKVSQITSPIPLNDGVRILEKLQAESETQPIDPGRIGVIGHEAGGIVALWLAYQRNPEKPSPPVSVAVAIDTPTRLDPSWMAKEIGGRLTVSAGTRLLFRLSIAEAGKEPIKSRLESISPWHLADETAPPTFLIYTSEYKRPLSSAALPREVTEHQHFGETLAEKLGDLEVERELAIGGGAATGQALLDFLKTHFSMID